MFISSESRESLDRLATFLESGQVVPALGRTYPFDQVPDAIADLVAGRTRGKAALTVG
jgi:NADPH:quinone reductase-like Zn-dependent oxidoreductase